MFYVYFHSKPDGSPFYVGKGCGKRASTVWHNRNRHYKFIVAKYGKENIKVSTIPCQSESDAFTMEMILIKAFRSLGYKLANMTDGGEGAVGATRSEDTRRKMAASKFGNKHTLGLKRGPMPEAQRDKLSATKRSLSLTAWNKGVPRTAEERAKMSAARRAGNEKRRAACL